ncbi:pentatricopeptide repeat-containing protein At1g12300, mitochondrial-like isoform X2 [Lotus japonicus]|uniref:pentatricopeptide repeat-containing protein At1g12300, mitochondrial-like isoform X2 n=1 Tax=Lotus japonicus TaxID=34305 RepID=UPI002588D031|nr:pentatricopeptide repeat-containing protein At1g12300, mitochondrial-like isoform X2 [Lotus japonicus]
MESTFIGHTTNLTQIKSNFGKKEAIYLSLRNTTLEAFGSKLIVDAGQKRGISGYIPKTSIQYFKFIALSDCEAEWNKGTNHIKEEGQWKDVRLLLNEKSLDVCSFNIIMDALCKQGLLLEAHAVCYEMIKRGVQPDVISYTILMDGYCLKSKVDEARKLFDMMIEAGLVPDVWSYNILIQGYCKIERVDEAMNLCEDMLTKNLVPNTVTYKYLFDGLCRFGRLPDAWNFLTRMHYRGHRPPDLTPYNIILETLCEQHLDKANKIFNSLIPEPNVQSYNILISGYCKNGRVDEAMSIYQNMCLRNIVRDSETFKLLINAFCKRKQCDKAIALYKNNRDLCPFKILMDGLRKNGMEEVAQRVSQLYGACDPDVALVRNQLAL